jgi:hypothetical protein
VDPYTEWVEQTPVTCGIHWDCVGYERKFEWRLPLRCWKIKSRAYSQGRSLLTGQPVTDWHVKLKATKFLFGLWKRIYRSDVDEE